MLSDDLHALQTATFEFDGGATNTVAEITVLERPFVATMFSSPEIILLAPTAAPCAGEVIDGVVLGRLRDDLGSPRALLQIVRLFLSEIDGRAAMIEDTAGRAELAVLARGARHLRPSAATLGATVLADVLTALEDAAEAGDAVACDQLTRRFATEVARTSTALELIAADLDTAVPVEV
jgi:HPt (histidine-containing phosphotransfer) domain-containing protein